MNNDTHAMSEVHFLRSSFNPFPLSFRRRKMRDVIEKRLRFESADRMSMSRLVDMFMNGESPGGSHSTKHREFVNQRHVSLDNSPMRSDYIFSDVDFVSNKWERKLGEIVISPFSMPNEEGRKGTGTEVFKFTDEVSRLVRDSILRHACSVKSPADDKQTKTRDGDSSGDMSSFDEVSSRSDGSSGRRSGSSSRSRSSLLRSDISIVVESMLSDTETKSSASSTKRRERRRKNKTYDPVVIENCDVFRTFIVLGKLLSTDPSTSEVSLSSLRTVVRNAITKDIRRLATDPLSKESVMYNFTTHPSLKAAVKKVRHPVDDLSSFVRSLFDVYDSPDYVAGLYDIRSLCRFFGINCNCLIVDVNDMRGEALWTEDPSGDGEGEGEGEAAPPVVIFLHDPEDGSFNLIAHRHRTTKENSLLLFTD